MSKQYDDSNRGVLFKNDRKAKDGDRDYSGSINVDGHDYWLSAWIREGRNGKFMSLSVKRKDGKPAPGDPSDENSRPPPVRRIPGSASTPVDLDSDIPF